MSNNYYYEEEEPAAITTTLSVVDSEDDGYEEGSTFSDAACWAGSSGPTPTSRIYFILRNVLLEQGEAVGSFVVDYFMHLQFQQPQLTFQAVAADTAPTIDTATRPSAYDGSLTTAIVTQLFPATAASETINYEDWASNIAGIGAVDLAAVVQEIVGRAGWESGNDIAVIVKADLGGPVPYSWVQLGDFSESSGAVAIRAEYFTGSSGNVDADVIGGELNLTAIGQQGEVAAGIDVICTAVALAINGQQGEAGAGIGADGGALELIIVGQAGDCLVGAGADGLADTLTIAGYGGALSVGVIPESDAQAFLVTGQDGAIEIGIDISGGHLPLIVSGRQGSASAGTIQALDITGGHQTLIVSGRQGSKAIGTSPYGHWGSYSITRQQGDSAIGADVLGLAGTATLQAQAATVSVGVDAAGGYQVLALGLFYGGFGAGSGNEGVAQPLTIVGRQGSAVIGIDITEVLRSYTLKTYQGNFALSELPTSISAEVEISHYFTASIQVDTYLSAQFSINSN